MIGQMRCVVVMGLLVVAGVAAAQELWTAKDGSIRNVDTRAMTVIGGSAYLATRSEVYAAGDAQGKWLTVFSLPPGENEIRCIAGSGRSLYVGTRRGLYRSEDGGKTWRDVFRTVIPEKNNIAAIEVSRNAAGKIFIGTEKGVFASDDGGSRWRDISGILKNRSVSCIAINSGHVYAGSDGGLYISRDGPYAWERIYVKTAAAGEAGVTAEGGDGISDGAEAEEPAGGGIACIAIRRGRVYAGLGKRVRYSDDCGKGWAEVPAEGLAGTVKGVLASSLSERLYCATSKGVYAYAPDAKRWRELYRGFEKSVAVAGLVFDGEDERSIWALTEKGLYRLEAGNYIEDQYIDIEMNMKALKILYDAEPDLGKLQQAALRFNEVHPDKIQQWRAEARLKALMPKISVGMDNSRSNTYEIYTSATKDYIVAGPDDISESVDVSISWELGDLIWSDDQTNIDVRSRLTTQLRNDILDDLRRVYFERKRLQYEIMVSPPKDAKARFEKQLRIQELTQAIDDLTGNYLSSHTSRLYPDHDAK